MAARVPPTETATPARPASQDTLLRTVLPFVTNVTVLTALLVYFGWKRSDVQARALGLDETIFGFSTRDYLLRSVDSLFVPLAVAVVVGVGWMWADGFVRRRLDDPNWAPVLQRVITVLTWSWLLLPALALAVLVGFGVGQLTFPLSFGLGALLTAHGVSLSRDLERRRGGVESERTWRTDVNRSLLAMLVLLSVFWTITLVAESRGLALADRSKQASTDGRRSWCTASDPWALTHLASRRSGSRTTATATKGCGSCTTTRARICSCTTDGPGKRACS